MTEFGKKMQEHRPRVKKVRKAPAGERNLKNHPQVTIPWGRGGSEHRPGLFTKGYLMQHSESSCADIFRALRENLEGINRMRIEIGEKAIRGCTYNSFAKYWHWLKLLQLIEPVGRREESLYEFLAEKQFYRLTDKGRTETRGWEDPVRTAHPEFG